MRIGRSENAIGYLLIAQAITAIMCHKASGPHFSTIMNEWAERQGKDHDRMIIDLMLSDVPDVPKENVEAAYNRASYMPCRRELTHIWPAQLCWWIDLQSQSEAVLAADCRSLSQTIFDSQ